MKRLLPVLMGFLVLLLSSTEGWSLPPCPGSPTSSRHVYKVWTDCAGNYIPAQGSKYVGEYKDGKEHGQGIRYYSHGRYVQEGIWEYGRFLYARKLSPTVIAKKLSPTVTAKKTPTKGSTLPPCPGSPTSSRHVYKVWTDCVGNYIPAQGSKYVGEYKDGKEHGQGIRYYSHERYVQEGIWEYGRFLYARKLSPTVIAKKLSPTVTAKKTPTKGSTLPPCPGSPTSSRHVYKVWTDCVGNYIPAQGSKYVGEYKDGKEHGQGIRYYSHERYVQEGIWEYGRFLYARKLSPTVTANQPCPGTYKPTWDNCIGTRTFHSGSKYVGGWKSGKEHGKGTLTYADGEKYVGGFRDGLHHGKGTITHANGKTLEGIWENDKFKSARD